MPTLPKVVAQFLSDASSDNSSIRWGLPTKKWQTQTSLKPAKDALEVYRTNPTTTNYNSVITALDGLTNKRKRKYRTTITQLKANIAKIKDAVDNGTLAIDGTPKVYSVERPADSGAFTFYTTDGEAIVENLTANKAGYIRNVLAELNTVSNRIGIDIDDLNGLIKSISKDAKLGATSANLAGTIWESAIDVLETEVVPRVGRDFNTLKTSGLVPDGAVFKGVTFTGSDFHKGGKQVLKLRYEKTDGSMQEVYYKPSNLKVDKLLFGSDGVASKIGGIDNYQIETYNDGGGDYGYMEAIDTGGDPTTADDVMGIYEGIAVNMAMSYYVGLDDVHQENVIMKKNSIQVIDMEATTGVFRPDPRAVTLGAFNSQLWAKAINEGIKPRLEKLAMAGTLKAVPEDSAIRTRMMQKFRQTITSLSSMAKRTDLQQLETSLARETTRTVPIATDTFQNQLIPIMTSYPTLIDWVDKLDEELAADPKDASNLLVIGKGQTKTPYRTIYNLLASTGVYTALSRGDVPYYTRDLGSSTVKDEMGIAITVTGYSKVAGAINTEMAARRTTQPDNLEAIFTAQGIGQVIHMNTNVKVFIQ